MATVINKKARRLITVQRQFTDKRQKQLLSLFNAQSTMDTEDRERS